MGDKIQSKIFAARAGVSTVPGHVAEVEDVATAVRVNHLWSAGMTYHGTSAVLVLRSIAS